jgi:hypothetical protein
MSSGRRWWRAVEAAERAVIAAAFRNILHGAAGSPDVAILVTEHQEEPDGASS